MLQQDLNDDYYSENRIRVIATGSGGRNFYYFKLRCAVLASP